jgi:hypothetical protein
MIIYINHFIYLNQLIITDMFSKKTGRTTFPLNELNFSPDMVSKCIHRYTQSQLKIIPQPKIRIPYNTIEILWKVLTMLLNAEETINLHI